MTFFALEEKFEVFSGRHTLDVLLEDRRGGIEPRRGLKKKKKKKDDMISREEEQLQICRGRGRFGHF